MDESVCCFATFLGGDMSEVSGQVGGGAIVPHKYGSPRACHYMSLRHTHKCGVWREGGGGGGRGGVCMYVCAEGLLIIGVIIYLSLASPKSMPLLSIKVPILSHNNRVHYRETDREADSRQTDR